MCRPRSFMNSWRVGASTLIESRILTGRLRTAHALDEEAGEHAQSDLKADRERLSGRRQVLADRIAEIEARDEAERRAAAPAPTPATGEARAELDRLQAAGELEPWQATALRGVFTEIEATLVEVEARLAETLRLALAQT